MVNNLAVGTIIITVTVLIHTFGLMTVTKLMARMVARFRMHGRRSRVVAMVSIVTGLFVVLAVEIWLWAACYLAIGLLPDLETALYFSIVTFSTIGYGDIVPAHEWRVLAALEGINGFLFIGWSTAYLVAAGTRVGPFKSGEHF